MRSFEVEEILLVHGSERYEPFVDAI